MQCTAPVVMARQGLRRAAPPAPAPSQRLGPSLPTHVHCCARRQAVPRKAQKREREEPAEPPRCAAGTLAVVPQPVLLLGYPS